MDGHIQPAARRADDDVRLCERDCEALLAFGLNERDLSFMGPAQRDIVLRILAAGSGPRVQA